MTYNMAFRLVFHLAASDQHFHLTVPDQGGKAQHCPLYPKTSESQHLILFVLGQRV